MDRYSRGISFFFKYLIEQKINNLLPDQIVREKHIRDISNNNKNLFFNQVEQLDIVNTNKNNILFTVEEFFDFIKLNAYEDLKIPINKYDRFNQTKRNSITNRKRVDSSIIEIAKEILLRDDMQFNKDFIDNETQLNLIDAEGNKKYWYGYTIIMYILLTYPIRNKQSRWLDSGELDEYIIDFNTKEYVKNKNKFAIKDRKECCIQIETDYISNKKHYVLYINTNKTGNKYKIPYMPDDILDLLISQIEWNNNHNTTITKPISSTEKRDDKNLSKSIEYVAPLFLFPSLSNKINFSVLTAPALQKFHCFLMMEVEKEIKIRTNKDIKLAEVETKVYADGRPSKSYKTIFDIHSLRVSGITNLIEAGVPVEIVSQFVAGHSSTVMTLYYNKNSIEDISNVIEDLHVKNKNNLTIDLEKLEELEDFEKQLFSSTQEFNKNNFTLLKENKSYWNIGLSGICPVSCEELGREDKSCARCQYWITGTPFIIGQVAEVNNLMYSIRKKSNKIKKLNLKYLTEQNDTIKGEIENIRLEVSDLISEWSIRYKYVNKSLTMLNDTEQNTNSTNNSLITSNKDIKLGMENVNDFGLAANICQNNEIIDGFDNNEAQLELEMFINKILMNNSIEPFLLRLSEEESLKSANLFSQEILRKYNHSHIEELVEGKLKLEPTQITMLEKYISSNNKQLVLQ